jgi:hypothetical protein
MSWAPEGNIKGPPGITAFTRQGVTPLVNGQAFIAVTFIAAMADASWVFGGCQVLNTVDSAALNIVVATITSKSASGFTIQLSGAPDSGNYFLQWAVAGAPTGGGATTYGLTGPTSGISGVASSSFMVALPVGTTVAAPVTVTPHDGGAGGTFSPTTIMLTTAAPSGAFTYTPSSSGVKTISTTNNGALTDPTALSYTSIAAYYTLIGPTTGQVSVASTNFTVALGAGVTVSGTVTITPHDAGTGAAGTFTPATVGLTNAAPSATFTYTPASTGVKTISATNSSTLVDPGSLSYNSTAAPPHLLNTLISYWKLDEPTGSGARADSQGTNTLVAPHAIAAVTGKINNASTFVRGGGAGVGGPDWLSCASNATLQMGSTSFTISLWVYMGTLPPSADGYTFISKLDATFYEYEIGSVNTGGTTQFQFFLKSGGTLYTATATPAVALATWYHLVGWFDKTNGQCHLRVNDATTYDSAAGAGTTDVGTVTLYVGRRAYVGAEAYCDFTNIDEIGLWKRLLTAQEITALYNGGAGLPLSSFTT